jgi:hypothetical protein
MQGRTMMRRKVTISLGLYAIIIIGGLGGLSGPAGADTEPNNDIAAAELISPGTHSGVLNVTNNPNDLLDYYKFNVTAGQIIGFDLRCGDLESGSVKYTMYRPNETQYQASDLLAPGNSQQLSWITNNVGAGQWYIRAEGPNNYSFDLMLTDQDDAQTAGDAGDDLNNPRAIEPNETYSGQEGDDDIADFYKFDAKAGQSLTLGGEIFNGPKQGNLTLYGVDKQALGSIDFGDPDPPPVALVMKVTGTYFIGVEAGICEYLLNLTLKGGDKPDIRIPSIAITAPINGTTVGNASFNLTGTASDDIGVASVEVSLSGIAWWMANGTDNWTYANLTIGEGINTIYARATDYAGKQNITGITLAYVPGGADDTERPQVFVTSPANGTTLNVSTFNISGTASDNYAVFKVEVSLSAIVWWMAEGTESWKYAGLTIGEGINSIWVRATDFAGNQNITWVHLAYVPGGANDTERPQVFVTSPANGTTLNVSTFDLKGTATDDFGVAKVEVSLSAIVWWTATGTASWSVRLMIGEGINSIWVKATDFAGNYNITGITLGYAPPGANDTERPQVFVTSPANGTTLNISGFDLSGMATDNFGVFKVEVSLSAIAWWMAEGTASWTYANLTIGEGINYIWVRATDFAGNYNITWITLAYDPGASNDTQFPKVWVTCPANGTTLNASTFDLVGTASDDYAVFKVEVSLSGIVWWLATGTLNWTYPWLSIGEGISSIWVKATDYAGKSTIIWVELAYVPGGANDTVKPNITIISPTAGTVSNFSAINLTGTASDNYGVFKVEASLNGVDWLLARGTTSWSYSKLVIGAGGRTIYIKATDFANNSNVTQVYVIFNPGKAGDTVKPTLSILGPKKDALLTKDKLSIVSGLASDNIAILNVELKVNGVSVPVNYAAGIWTATNIKLKEGKNTLVVTATDYAGNTQTSSVSVTYEKPKPQPGFGAVVLVCAIAVMMAILSGRKRA